MREKIGNANPCSARRVFDSRTGEGNKYAELYRKNLGPSSDEFGIYQKRKAVQGQNPRGLYFVG